MKKFLAFLLIVAIACTAVEDIDFEGFFGKLWGWVKKAWNWLGNTGILNVAASFCPGWLGAICQAAASHRFN